MSFINYIIWNKVYIYIYILSNYCLLFLPTICPVMLSVSTLSLYGHLICILPHAPDMCLSQKDSENQKMSDPQTLCSSFKASSPSSFHLETFDRNLQKCCCGTVSATQQLFKFGHKSKINGWFPSYQTYLNSF